jgi:DNA topoisomerase-1
VYEILNEEDKKKVKRITFNEITKNAVLEAIADPRSINNEWVDSQFTRRILDRLVGFTLSKLISHKLSGARSAGRVQTVALKLIYDREKEIQAFKSYKW